jgi:hypothetical protein
MFAVAVMLAGCGGKYFERQDPKEIPEGPGMFSGKEGAFVFSTDKKPAAQQTVTAGGEKLDAASFQEFREYQEFQRWKAASKDGAEFREFQDWREWKAYRSWKARQPN